MTPRVVILVPRREGIQDRDSIWAWVRQWWRDNQPTWEIFEGHHDEGPFSRSAAINRAAGSATPWDVAVIIDADVICDPVRAREGVKRALADDRLVLPFDVRHDLNLAGSRQVMTGYQGSWQRFVHRTYTEMCSSVVILNRHLWDEVGGFDETFAGWGFEDNAFAAACETFGTGPLVKIPGDLWHLFHGTAPEGKRGSLTHSRNKARAGLYLAARGHREAMRALQATVQPAFEHRPAGIPPILHRVVPEQTTEQVEAWWTEFGAMHPEWTLMTHRDPLVPADWPETSRYWARCHNGAELADLVRLEALLRWGGIYVDSDVQPLRPLDPLLPLSAFAAWEDHRAIPNAVMGAVPSHPAIRACLDLAIERIDEPTWERGPGVLTAILPGRSDVLLLPAEAFYGVHYRDPEREAKMAGFTASEHPAAFALHWYAGSWLEPARQRPLADPVPGRTAAVETLDVFASESQYVDHLAPVWLALPDELRGAFVVPDHLREHAAEHGVEAAEALPLSDRRTLLAAYTDLKRARRRGRTRLALMQHGIGQSYSTTNESYPGGADNDDVELFLVPNQHAADRWTAVYPDARVEIVGSPRLERLPTREAGPGPVVAVSFHWRAGVAPETKPAWEHFAPALEQLADRFMVVGHGHPRILEELAIQYRRRGIEVVADFEEVCRRADVYVCDNSSTLYEFAATGRPVVVLNAPSYRRGVEHGLRFWQAATVGVQVDEPADLLYAVEAALEDAPEQQRAREAALAVVYGFRAGAPQRAAGALTGWITQDTAQSERVAVPG